MLSNRTWTILNISFGLLALLLGLYLAGISFPSLGQAASLLDKSAPLCMVQWKENLVVWDELDQCCLQARKQLSCDKEEKIVGKQKLTRICTTGKTSVKFHLNEKAYYYCQKQAFW